MESSLAKLVSLFQGVDSTFSVLVFASIILFVGAEAVWFYNSRKTGVPGLNQDDSRLKFIWNVAPAFVLFVLLFVHAPRVSKSVSAPLELRRGKPAHSLKPVSAPLPLLPKKGGA